MISLNVELHLMPLSCLEFCLSQKVAEKLRCMVKSVSAICCSRHLPGEWKNDDLCSFTVQSNQILS